MKNVPGRRNKKSPLPLVKISDEGDNDSLSQQIEQLLKQEIENGPDVAAIESQGKPDKPATQPRVGKVLIINDAPHAIKHVARWLALTSYNYTVVQNDDEAQPLLEQESFDIIMRSSEFSFTRHSWAFTLLKLCRLRRI